MGRCREPVTREARPIIVPPTLAAPAIAPPTSVAIAVPNPQAASASHRRTPQDPQTDDPYAPGDLASGARFAFAGMPGLRDWFLVMTMAARFLIPSPSPITKSVLPWVGFRVSLST